MPGGAQAPLQPQWTAHHRQDALQLHVLHVEDGHPAQLGVVPRRAAAGVGLGVWARQADPGALAQGDHAAGGALGELLVQLGLQREAGERTVGLDDPAEPALELAVDEGVEARQVERGGLDAQVGLAGAGELGDRAVDHEVGGEQVDRGALDEEAVAGPGDVALQAQRRGAGGDQVALDPGARHLHPRLLQREADVAGRADRRHLQGGAARAVGGAPVHAVGAVAQREAAHHEFERQAAPGLVHRVGIDRPGAAERPHDVEHTVGIAVEGDVDAVEAGVDQHEAALTPAGEIEQHVEPAHPEVGRALRVAEGDALDAEAARAVPGEAGPVQRPAGRHDGRDPAPDALFEDEVALRRGEAYHRGAEGDRQQARALQRHAQRRERSGAEARAAGGRGQNASPIARKRLMASGGTRLFGSPSAIACRAARVEEARS